MIFLPGIATKKSRFTTKKSRIVIAVRNGPKMQMGWRRNDKKATKRSYTSSALLQHAVPGTPHEYTRYCWYVVPAGGLRCHRVATSTISAIELFFCDFSAARLRFVARNARSESPQSRGPCPRADPPSPRPSRSASEVARSRLRGLPHAARREAPLRMYIPNRHVTCRSAMLT